MRLTLKQERIKFFVLLINDIKDIIAYGYLVLSLFSSISECDNFSLTHGDNQGKSQEVCYYKNDDWDYQQGKTDECFDVCNHSEILMFFLYPKDNSFKQTTWMSVVLFFLGKVTMFVLKVFQKLTRNKTMSIALPTGIFQAALSIKVFSMASLNCTDYCITQIFPDSFFYSINFLFAGYLFCFGVFVYCIFRLLLGCLCCCWPKDCFSQYQFTQWAIYLYFFLGFVCTTITNCILLIVPSPIIHIQVIIKIILVTTIIFSCYQFYDIYSMKKNKAYGTIYYKLVGSLEMDE